MRAIAESTLRRKFVNILKRFCQMVFVDMQLNLTNPRIVNNQSTRRKQNEFTPHRRMLTSTITLSNLARSPSLISE